MHVQALFFAAYRDAVGSPALELELPEGSSVSDLVRHLRDRGSPWNRLPEDPAVAVNQSYAADDPILATGDEVAFIPPVAGG